MKYFIIFITISFNLYAKTINVAVSSNISYVIDELIKKFNKSSNTNIKVIISSSGKLLTQIVHNMPIDLFLSADIKYPNYLYKNGFTKTKPIYMLMAL